MTTEEKSARAADYALGMLRKGAKSALLGARSYEERLRESGAGDVQMSFAVAARERAEALWEMIRFE
jgi:hypothetical protein